MKEVGLALKKFLRGADLFLLFVCLLSSGLSMVLISSATKTMKDGADRYLMVQGGAIAIGVVLFLLFTLIDVEWLANRWILLSLFGVGMLFLLIPFGEGGNTGNTSWAYLPGLPTGIQPAEMVKISFILVMAKQMYSMRERLSGVISVGLLCAHLGIMVLLIRVLSKDDGMMLVYCFIFLFMCIASGLKVRWFALGATLLGVSIPIIWNNVLDEFQRKRILVVFNPELDPLKYGWHAIKSKTALGAGKLLGQGLYQGQQTQYGQFPAKHTDFIFSVAGEELGFAGCMAIMLLLTIIIVRCLYIALRAKSGLCALVCVGVAGMMIFQTFENIGMCVGVTPIVGLTLPFISYGGSSTVTMYAAMGLISSVRMHPMPEWQKRQILVQSRSRATY